MRRMKFVQPAALFQQVLKTCVTKQGRLLGLDVGSKYVGLAVSDEHNKLATPLSVLKRTKKDINAMAQDLQTLVTQLSVAGFVVGCPLKKQDKSITYRGKIFIEELCKTRMLDGVSYTYWDDKYTSRCVEVLLEPLDMNPVEANTIVDKFAAVAMLQGYLDNMNLSLDSQGLNS